MLCKGGQDADHALLLVLAVQLSVSKKAFSALQRWSGGPLSVREPSSSCVHWSRQEVSNWCEKQFK